MPRIKLLAPHIISKTAAGEVVERPASVVKELIENALDAGASIIKIQIQNSGLDRIEVVDNGDGMDIEDVMISFKPHTTSKILDENDLNKISSFGFRGEALSSIASVSRMAIQSRVNNHYVGHRVDLEGGEVLKSMPAGMPIGTIVEVKDLFFNTPARKKFLKSASTEFRNILDIVVNAAMSFSHIGFTLINEDRIVLDLPRYQTLSERTIALLGEPISSQLVPFVHDEAHFKVTGYISKPQLSSIGKSHQYIFVNKRFVSNNIVSSAVKEAYGSLLEPRAHPALILFLELPYELVDVNVHPRKEEVSFYDDSQIFEFVKKAVQNALDLNDLTYSTDIIGNKLDDKKALPYLFNHLKDSVDSWQVYENHKELEIMQINNLYLVTQTKKGMVLIDQHAAHERILFEQFLEVYESLQTVVKNTCYLLR